MLEANHRLKRMGEQMRLWLSILPFRTANYLGGTNMEGKPRSEHFTEIEDRFAGYEVYDRNYEKVGKVDDLFVDENDQPEYIGVKMGFLGTKSTLVPFDIVRVNDQRQLVQVGADKDTVKDGPAFDDDQEITPEFEERVYTYFDLERPTTTEARRAYGAYYSFLPRRRRGASRQRRASARA
jgi:hypothetical protein